MNVTNEENGMAKNNRFGMGGCFACEVCGRKTRDTGEQAFGSKLCPQCWEVAGIENEWQDSLIDEHEAKERIIALRNVCVAKGGNLEKFNRGCMIELA
jgi:hypothetical protein